MICKWIVITHDGYYLCERCGTRIKVPTAMMSFGMMEGMMKGFLDEHRNCKETKSNVINHDQVKERGNS